MCMSESGGLVFLVFMVLVFRISGGIDRCWTSVGGIKSSRIIFVSSLLCWGKVEKSELK